MAIRIGGRPGGSRRSASWWIRLTLYLAFLLATAYAVTSLRGRIPMAFGLTPIRVYATSVSVTQLPTNGEAPLADVGVAVRIIGSRPVPDGVRLNQFELRTDDGTPHRPYASSFVFGPDGTMDIAPGDTLTGVLMFTLPFEADPKELWWQP